ncbi:hypothetical protein PQG02_20590 [Nostoc sp. UHCC 0926]|uniref:hypothetical protein n=1 Tax=unclassified Nostoc TaxID=2593658 RepID=UPI00235E8FC8|nr:hypothetical protein [Nostoc sp. UHCC 0926]WDD31116.1 hypothetical protein PQG02_20590 [Nostoc sp. UHCC 0926]
MADLNNSGTGNSSSGGNNVLKDSPWGRLIEVLPNKEKDLSNLFSGVGKGEGSGSSPFGGSGTGSKPDLAYGGNPFAGDNFWNIFAGGKNPSAGGANQGSAIDPLTGFGSKGSSISTTEIPDGFGLRGTIDNLVNSRLKETQGSSVIPSFGGGGSSIPSSGGGGSSIPSFGGGGSSIPSSGGGSSSIPSFGGGGSSIPSFGGGGSSIPSFGGGGSSIPSFGGGGSSIPSFGGGGSSIPSFGGSGSH